MVFEVGIGRHRSSEAEMTKLRCEGKVIYETVERAHSSADDWGQIIMEHLWNSTRALCVDRTG